MFNTKFGPFNGATWEALCQQVFKRKYQADGYQQMPASPGDFGIEGFTVHTGLAFQCYCPEKHYSRSELYEKQRDKITQDLGKLKTYQADLEARLGSTKLKSWIFVTPGLDRNSLLVHARNKEAEVRRWKLPFLADDFCVLLHDGDHYAVEINEIRVAAGEAMVFDDCPPVLAELKGEREDYERNVLRKSGIRLADKSAKPAFQQLVSQLTQRTIESFLESDGYLRRIASTAPTVYVRLVRLINEYEEYVIEASATWSGTAEDLTTRVREGLAQRIAEELAPTLDMTNASKIARFMTARWLAVCELNYD